MQKLILRVVLACLLAAGVSSCFPELPDPRLIDNLRVLAIQADPATADFTGFPPPLITVTALVVDPADPDLSEVDHSWGLELPDDVDLDDFEGMLPPGPYGTSLTVDISGNTARDDTVPEGLVLGVLPLRYEARSEDDHRAAVKLVSFVLPDLDGTTGRPFYEGNKVEVPPDPEGLINENPRIVSIQVGDGRTFQSADEELPGINDALFVGSVDEAGVEFTIEIADDGALDELSVSLYRTTGCPDLAPDELELLESRMTTMPQAKSDDPCGEDGGAGSAYGGGYDLPGDEEEPSIKRLPWRPFPGQTSEGARLFVVLRDEDGGQSWQELRPEDPVEQDP